MHPPPNQLWQFFNQGKPSGADYAGREADEGKEEVAKFDRVRRVAVMDRLLRLAIVN